MGAKYSIYKTIIALPAVASMLVTTSACTDDFGYRNLEGKRIEFKLTAPDAWHDGMSVDENSPSTRCTSVRALSGGDTKLYLHAMVADNPAVERVSLTRGTPVKNEDDFKKTYSSFSLSGICYTGAYPDDESNNNWTTEYAHNLIYSISNDGTCLPTNEGRPLIWPSKGSVRFFAFAPTLKDFGDRDTGGELEMSEPSHHGSPTLTYTVPTDVKKQIDLMTARTNVTAAVTPGNVELPFRHALTAVRIKCGKDMLAGKISEVKISGVYGSGTQVIGSETWEPDGSPASYTISFSEGEEIDLPADNNSDDKIHAGQGTVIVGTDTDGLTFMLLPQKLPEGASITIKFTDYATSAERTLTGSIAGQTWQPGKIVTYTLSQSSIHIQATLDFNKNPDKDIIPYSGVWYDVEYTAKARITQEGIDPEEIEIPADKVLSFRYAEADENGQVDDPKKWQSCTIDKDMPGYLKISAQSEYNKMTTNFGPDIGSPESRFSLSDEYGASANCYLVDRAGYYSLKLVYGNGSTAAGKTNGLTFYPCHDDVNPAAGNISDGYDAVLVWQDAPDLIDPKSVDLDDKKENLIFNIRKPTLAQGNAVVAVRNSSKQIIWSWHIWVTPYKKDFYSKTSSDFYNSKTDNGPAEGYYFAQYNLGWCDPHGHNDARKLNLQAIVDMSAYGGAKETPVDIGTFTQQEFKGSNVGDNTYYQWGRKDPMLGGIYNANTPKYTYQKYNKNYPNDKSKWTNDKAEFTMENKQVFNQYYNEEEKCDYSFCKNTGDAIDTDLSEVPSKGVTIGYSIQHPYMFVTNSRYDEINHCGFDYRNHWHVPYKDKKVKYLEPTTHIMYNAWNANPDVNDAGLAYGTTGADARNALKVIKSVYDPCPPGFVVPPIDAFRGIAKLSVTVANTDYKGIGQTTYNSGEHVWTMTYNGQSIKFPQTGVRDYALRTNEWESVKLISGTGTTDINITEFYKTSYPAFDCLTFLSSATIIDKGALNAYQVLLFAIDKRTEPDAKYPNMKSCFGPSSNSYGLPVRPIKEY